MTPDKWQEIKENIAKQFTIEDEGKEDLLVETGEGEVKQGEADFIVFESPLGKLKLQFGQKPKVEEKKYHYSHRAGTGARVEYKFSDKELVNTFKAFKWNDADDDWKEMDGSAIANL